MTSDETSLPIKQSDKSFEDVNKRIWDYMVARDWDKQDARNLAISINLEAAELLEHYQWGGKAVGDKNALAEELADIFIYAFEFAQANSINITDAIESKLQKAEKKYPAVDFKDKTKAEQDKNWYGSKLKHQKEGL